MRPHCFLFSRACLFKQRRSWVELSHLLCSHFLDRTLHACNVCSQRISTCANAIDKDDEKNSNKTTQERFCCSLLLFTPFAEHLQWVSAQRQWLSIQLLQSPDCLAWAQYQWRQLPKACPGLEAGLLIYPGSGQTDGCLAPLNLLNLL